MFLNEPIMRARTTIVWGLAAAALIVGCGGGSTSPSTPPENPVNTSTVTIANNRVSPVTIVVPRGTQVTFINSDNRSHDIQSDPHPEHTDCPEIGQVGFLNPGQSRQTGNLNIARTCGYHDHSTPEVKSLLGSIVIQ
jgi:plastocyanin